MNYRNQVLFNTVANTCYLAAQWALTVIATRFVGIEMAGILTLAVSVTNILYCVQAYGIRNYQVSDIRGEFTPAQYLGARIISVLAGVVLCIVYLLVSGFSVVKATIIFLFFLFRTSEALSDVFYGELQKQDRLDVSAKSYLLRSLLTVVLFTSLTWATKDLVLPMLAVATCCALVTFLFDRKKYVELIPLERRKLDGNWIKTSLLPLKTCFFMMATNQLPIIIASLPRMMLDRFYGEELLGYYGNVSMPTALIVAIVPNLLTPIMTLYGKWIQDCEHRKMVRMYFMTLLGTCAVGLACVAGVWLLGDPVMTLVYTDGIRPYLHYLYPLILTTVLYAITMCNNAVLISMRKNTSVWVSAVVGAIVCVILSFVIIAPMGVNGVILSMGASYGVQVLLQIIVLLKEFSYWKNKQ